MKRYKIFVINLKRDFKRRKFITQHLQTLCLDFTLVEAIDGKELPPESYKKLVDEAAVTPRAKWLTKGAIGCALSHHKVYQMIVAEDLDYALVLEDDCILDKNVGLILEEIAAYLHPNEVVLLHYRSWKIIRLILAKSKQIAGKFYSGKPQEPEALGSAVAYIITREACRKMADFILPIRNTSDNWGHFLRENILDNISCIYPMAIDTADFKSSIDYVPSNSVEGKIASFIDKNKIFPFYQILRYKRMLLKRKLQRIEFID